MSTFKIDDYSGHDKAIAVAGPLAFEVDYDDVFHPGVDVLLPHMLRILNEHWTDLYAWRCENEDCDAGYDTLVPISENPCASICHGCGQIMSEIKVFAS